MLAAQQPVSDDGAFLQQFFYQVAWLYRNSPFLCEGCPEVGFGRLYL